MVEDSGDQSGSGFGLTHVLHLGMETIPPATAVRVAERARFRDHLFMSLFQDAGGAAEVFAIRHAFRSRGDLYLLLSHRASISADMAAAPLVVVRVQSSDRLLTVTDEQLRQLSPVIAASLARDERLDIPEVVGALGNFADVAT